jgi:hypothetical protein
MSVEMISAVFTGLIGLLTALAALLANRSRRVSEDSRTIRKQARELQKKFVAAMGHIFVLETTLASRGVAPPERPKILEQDDEDDDGPAPERPRARALP